MRGSDVKTLVNVDFYDHESQKSDCAVGFEPVINTLFSFKNKIDSFYCRHLQNDFMTADFYAFQDPKNSEKLFKLGTAKISLHTALQKDFSF